MLREKWVEEDLERPAKETLRKDMNVRRGAKHSTVALYDLYS